MKMKLVQSYSNEFPKGTEVTIDKVIYDPNFNGRYKVRVIDIAKKPMYLAITWFDKKANELPPLWLVKDGE